MSETAEFYGNQFMLSPDIEGFELNGNVAARLMGHVVKRIGNRVHEGALDPEAWFIIDITSGTTQPDEADTPEDAINMKLAQEHRSDQSKAYMAFMKGVMEHVSSLGRIRRWHTTKKLQDDLLAMPRPLDPLLRRRRDGGHDDVFGPRPGSDIVLTA